MKKRNEMSNLKESELQEIMNDIFRKVMPTKEKPMYWMQGSYSYKSDGEHIYIRMEDDSYEIVTINPK